ncbi:hypothetical protein HNR46_002221 [Haloferula luteola]|uniref:PEP-CTERM protein-sorting domain-containing protein n=1 Tax=Haloferula luteola TaxID=595692 RepID=A0A840VDM3_9BACT|nr:PEP-CTERM sorting domain-containing protein [Haloferula luteola]MBB5351980.1 hypothetical protein [Haloferula luteola]
MKKKSNSGRMPSSRLVEAASTVAVLGTAASHGAVVYQSFELTFQDSDPLIQESGSVGAVFHFDGSQISYDQTETNGLGFYSSDDYQESGFDKTIPGGREAFGYQQTQTILSAGDTVQAGFVAANEMELLEFFGSESDQYVGVSTPAGQLGWVRFSYTDDGDTVTVHDAAFETVANTPIVAGAVPEPSVPVLTGLLGGVAALRRRRRVIA